MPGEKEVLKTTCPRDCYDACGIVAIKRDGAITRVLGDPDHHVSRGALCGKCALAYNGVFRDSEARLLTPLKRAGAKGEGRFEPVSWDEAIGAIAARFKQIAGGDGADRIVHAHYTGTCSLIANNFPMRFLGRLGAREVEPDTVCNMAGHVALDYVIGTSVIGFDPRTAKDAHSILVWGANPSASAPHQHKHWLKEAPGTVIVVDPVRHPTAEQADLHLQPFPGSDAALAFAMVHVLVRDGLIDRAFLDAHTIGWDELELAIAPCTPAWGEARTGVPAAEIEEAARIYGSGPALLWLGQGLQRQAMGGNVMRACALLPAVTGNYGKPGAGLLYLNGGGRKGVDGDYLSGAALSQSPPSFSQMELAARLEDPADIQAFLCWNINPAASSPEQARFRRALMRDDLFTVVVDIFQTDTADYADYVLPAASFLEFDDLVSGYFNLSFSAQAKLQEPLGQSLPNQEIFRRLARAMGYAEPELYEDDAAIIAEIMGQVGVAGSFDEFKRVGTVFPDAAPVIQFEGLAFPTPSGKIEIASARAEADGHPRLPLAEADPKPAERQAAPALAGLALAHERFLRQRPTDCGPPGRSDRDIAPFGGGGPRPRGRAAGAAQQRDRQPGACDLAVAETIPPGVALSPKGRWPRQEGTRANVNVLNPGIKSDMGESTCVHGVEVEIAAV